MARLGANDLKAIMQFALISLVILPVLPNRTYGPFAVLNPRNIWWMVVLIVGISLGGYIAYKFLGQRAGIVLGGVLGGMVAGAATTVSYAKRAAAAPGAVGPAAIVITIASAVVFARVLLEIATVAPAFLPAAAQWLMALLILLAVGSFALWFRGGKEHGEMPEQENPLYLRDIRIERIDLVTSALQLPVYCIGRLLKAPRDASNSDRTRSGLFQVCASSMTNCARLPSGLWNIAQ